MESGFVELKQNNNHENAAAASLVHEENVLEPEKGLYKLQYELSTNAHMTP